MTPAGGAAAWAGARHILAVRLDNLGDVLMTTPALTALAGAGGRQRRVTLLASTSGALLRDHVPAIADVIACDAPWVKGPAHSAASDRRFLAMLMRRRFDAAVVFTVCTQSALPAALMCRMAGIPLRLAYSRENPYGLLTDWQRETDACGPGMRHEVARQLALVRSVGFETADARLVFACRESDRDSARRQLALAGGAPGRPYVLVHPGATAASRRYPPHRYGLAARAIAAQSGAQVVFAGGPDDLAACHEARLAMGVAGGASVVLAGQLTLGELGALIADARVLVCNNSAPAHIAAAVGTPVVVLYALTNPQHTPWQVPAQVLHHDVACRNCLQSVCPQRHHACLLGVSADEVANAALALWRQAAPPRLQPAAVPG